MLHRLEAASVLQASGFRGDAALAPTSGRGQIWLAAFVSAEHGGVGVLVEAAQNPEVAGSNPAPATEKDRIFRGFSRACE